MLKICQKAEKWIQVPRNLSLVKSQFASKYGFPDCVGAIDCTHIKIQSVGGEHAELYRNRKSYFSIIVQAICGPELSFYNVMMAWFSTRFENFLKLLCQFSI